MRKKITKYLIWTNIIGYIITIYQFFIAGDRSWGTIIGVTNVIFSVINFMLVKSCQIKNFVISNNPFTEEICTSKALFKRGIIIYISVCVLIIILCVVTDSLIFVFLNCFGVPTIFMCFTIYISIIDKNNLEKYFDLCHYFQLVPYIMFIFMAYVYHTLSFAEFLGLIFGLFLFL